MKKLTQWTLAAFFLLAVVPHIGNYSMAFAFILFYAVNPIFAAVCGVAASSDVKHLWPLPVIVGALFLLGCRLWFTLKEIQFWYYSIIYIAIGLAAMTIGAMIRKHRT